jgi:hypothetical protein
MGLFSIFRISKTMVVVGAAGLMVGLPGAAHAQFQYLSSIGNIQFSEQGLAGGGLPTNFNGLPGYFSGQMTQAGGLYPQLTGPINFFNYNNSLGNGIYAFRNSDVGPVGPGSNFGGGFANMAAARNGSASIWSSKFIVGDRGNIGTAAALTMSGTANYLYTGFARNFTTGMYLGMAAQRLANVNSFVEAGLAGSVVVNGTTFVMPSIVFAWDGVAGLDPLSGPNADFISASRFLVSPDYLGANTVAFQAVSNGANVFIPRNANVQVNVSFTLFGDPASIDMIDVPSNNPDLGPLPELSPAADAANTQSTFAPEPGSIGLAIIGGMGLIPVLRRRKA